jgi:hypothetical protein
VLGVKSQQPVSRPRVLRASLTSHFVPNCRRTNLVRVELDCHLGVVGCGSAAAQGGSCKAGAGAAGFSEFAGSYLPQENVAQFIGRTMIGGIASELGGGKFQNGAVTAAFTYLLNCGVHDCLKPGSGAPRKGADSDLTARFLLDVDSRGKPTHYYVESNKVCSFGEPMCEFSRAVAALQTLPGPMLSQPTMSNGQLVWVGPGWIRGYRHDTGVLNVTTPVHIFDGGGNDRGWVVRRIVSVDGALYVRSEGAGSHLSAMLGGVNQVVIREGIWRLTDSRVRSMVLDRSWTPQ